MKVIYTILFFFTTLCLIASTVLFIYLLDNRAGFLILSTISVFILAVIFTLVILLQRYLKIPR
jgi:hypothetical protein